MKLRIKPVEYNGMRLDEVGEGVVRAFYPLIGGFHILRPLRISNAPAHYFSESWHSTPYSAPFFRTEKYPPYHAGVDAERFLYFILRYGEPVLGITSLPVLDIRRDIMYGKALSGAERSSFVSTYSKEFGPVDSDDHLGKLIRLSIHEVGHTFGLEHHDNHVEIASNLCPMEDGHRDYALGGHITWSEFLLASNTRLCDQCREQLGI